MKIGDLGIQGDLEPGDLVKSAVVVANVVDQNGEERLEIDWTENQSFVERVGMLRLAEQMDYYERRKEGEDD